MPIDDVDYLLENSERDSVTLFIDSSTRAKEFYPNPASYVIDFTEPVRNVFGIEILDAAIPVSTYNIDKHNNIFAYTQVFFAEHFGTAHFEEYFNELQDCSVFNTLFEAKSNADIFIVNAGSFGAAHFDTMKASLERINDKFSTMIYMKRTVIENSGIMKTDATLEGARLIENMYGFEYMAQVYILPLSSPYLSIIQGMEFSILENTNIVYYETLRLDKAELDVLVESIKSITNENFLDLYICNTYYTLEEGMYDSTVLMQYLGNILKIESVNNNSRFITNAAITPTQVNKFGSFDKTLRFKFIYRDLYPFIFDMEKSTCQEPLGFATIPYDGSKITDYYKPLSHRRNKQLFMSQYSEADQLQFMIAPNVINLMGIRYLLLRCPEIENHLLGSFAFGKYCPGLGMFKLASGMDITNLRFDYVSLVKKPFHPIGKLSRLTLRFETKDGNLYDFKGVDHNMMICIKFYAPKLVKRTAASVLNPNYNPNYLEYHVNRLALDGEHDEEEEEENEEDDEFQTFLTQQKLYQYDSGEDDEDGDV